MMNISQIWSAIGSTSGLGPLKAQQIARWAETERRSVEDLASMDGEAIASAIGLSEGLACALAHEISQTLIDPPSRRDDRMVLPGEDGYPNGRFLSAEPALPVALWVAGRTSLTDDGSPALAVAGSRDAGDDLLQIAHTVGAFAARSGWTVVSGLAAGVDSAAHQGALDAGGSTVGVMASGLDARGRHWQPDSLDDVCIVSQFQPSEPWSGPRAMQRNSTIAALSDNVVIIASGEKGGSWEMGQLCLKRGKPLFVLDLDETIAAGNQRLIRAGATRFASDDLAAVITLAPPSPQQESLF